MLPILYLQAFALMLLAMLFAFFFRNAALAIVTYILFFFPIEPIIRAIIPGEGGMYLPIKTLSSLTPMPDFIGITFSESLQALGNASDELFGMQHNGVNAPVAITIILALGYAFLFILAIRQIILRRNF